MVANSTGTPRNLITEYERLAVEDIEDNIQPFIVQWTRQAYNSVQLFQCLTNSMIESVHLNILSDSDNYMKGGNPVGELLFKLII